MIAALSGAAWRQLMSVFGFTRGPKHKEQETSKLAKADPRNDLKIISRPLFQNGINNIGSQKDLLNAITEHNLGKLQNWISLIKDPNLTITITTFPSKYETFPLILAAASNHDSCELIDALIKAGAQTCLKDSHQRSAVMVAAAKGHLNKFTRLLELSKQESVQHFSQVLRSVVESNKVAIFESFIRHINKYPQGFYRKAYKLAQELGSKNIQKYLLDNHYVSSDDELISRLEATLRAA